MPGLKKLKLETDLGDYLCSALQGFYFFFKCELHLALGFGRKALVLFQLSQRSVCALFHARAPWLKTLEVKAIHLED